LRFISSNISLDRKDSSTSEVLYVFISAGLLDVCISAGFLDVCIRENFIMMERNKRSDNTKTNIKTIGKIYLGFFDGFSMVQP
jgi:hypothetical protein